MKKILAAAAAAILALSTPLLAQTPPVPLPAVNAPLQGCVNGRAIRAIDGFPACNTTAAPVASSCGTSPTMSPNATDYFGIVTWTGLISACTITLSRDYGQWWGCVFSSNSNSTQVGGTVSTVGGKSVIQIGLSLSLNGGKVTYICGPG